MKTQTPWTITANMPKPGDALPFVCASHGYDAIGYDINGHLCSMCINEDESLDCHTGVDEVDMTLAEWLGFPHRIPVVAVAGEEK